MIGVLILAQKDLGAGLVEAVSHMFGGRPPLFEALAVNYDQEPAETTREIQARLAALDQGAGVLILADIYGATHANAACRLLQRDRIEMVAGVNLPMLIRVLNYRDQGLKAVVDKAISGGCDGIVHAQRPSGMTAAGKP